MRTYKELERKMSKLTKLLEKKNYIGQDVSLDESLYFYRFVCKDTMEGDLEVIISVNDSYTILEDYYDPGYEIKEDYEPKFFITTYSVDDIIGDDDIEDVYDKIAKEGLERVFIENVLDENINIHESYFGRSGSAFYNIDELIDYLKHNE